MHNTVVPIDNSLYVVPLNFFHIAVPKLKIAGAQNMELHEIDP